MGEEVFPQPFPSFVAVAEQDVNGGTEVAVGQPLELRSEEGQRGGDDQELFVGKAAADRAGGLITALTAGVIPL